MKHEAKDKKTDGKPGLAGMIAEFSGPEELVEAIRKTREAGYTELDACSPFPVHGVDAAIGMKRSRLQYITIGGAIAGAGTGLLMQWWMVTVDYPIILAGKPYFSLPAFVPIMFELTILFAALSTFVGLLAFGGLPKFNHPLFGSSRFRRVTTDKFFLCVDAKDPKFDAVKTMEFLNGLNADAVELVEELSNA